MIRNHDETSEALLVAAHRLLSEEGPEALTVRRIAQEAGMSTMNVYSRFGGKDGVIDELYADGYRRLIDELAAIPASDDVPGDILRVAQTYRRFALDNPAYYGVMFVSSVTGFSPSQESSDIGIQALYGLVDRVRIGQERGDIAIGGRHDAIRIAAWLWATCHGLVSLELDGVADEYIEWPSIFELGMRTAIAGLHPSAAAALRP